MSIGGDGMDHPENENSMDQMEKDSQALPNQGKQIEVKKHNLSQGEDVPFAKKMQQAVMFISDTMQGNFYQF